MTKSELRQILINARTEKNYTHEQVAALASYNGKRISRQFYGMIENGDRRPSVEVAKSIAKVLDVDWTIFFELTGNQTLLSERKKQAI